MTHIALVRIVSKKKKTAQEHSMQYRYWKQEDYKKKVVMFHENVIDCKTNSWQQEGSSLHPSTLVNKDVKIRINNFKDLDNMTTLLIERQDGGGIRSSRETCRMLRLRRPHHGKIPLGNGSHGGGISRDMMSSE